MQNLLLLEFLAESFWYHMHYFQCLAVPVELSSHWDCKALKMVYMAPKNFY